MRKIYQLKSNPKHEKQMKELDDKRRKEAEAILGIKIQPYQWEIYKKLMMKRKKDV